MNKSNRVSFDSQFYTDDAGVCEELCRIDNCCASCLYDAGKLTSKEVLGAVISNELTECERKIIQMHWFGGHSLNRIAQLYGMSRESVRRAEERAKNKIYSSMKYIILYDELLDGKKSVPEDFHFKIIRCTDGKELIS